MFSDLFKIAHIHHRLHKSEALAAKTFNKEKESF